MTVKIHLINSISIVYVTSRPGKYSRKVHDLSWPKYLECTDGCNCATKLEADISPAAKFLPESVQLRLYLLLSSTLQSQNFPF